MLQNYDTNITTNNNNNTNTNSNNNCKGIWFNDWEKITGYLNIYS